MFLSFLFAQWNAFDSPRISPLLSHLMYKINSFPQKLWKSVRQGFMLLGIKRPGALGGHKVEYEPAKHLRNKGGPTASWAALGRASGAGKWSSPRYTRDMDILTESSEGPRRSLRAWSTSQMRRGWERRDHSAWRGEGSDHISAYKPLLGRCIADCQTHLRSAYKQHKRQ